MKKDDASFLFDSDYHLLLALPVRRPVQIDTEGGA